jgi:signal transduction histidine kinase
VLIVVVAVSALTSATISRPLRALVHQFRRVAAGDRGASLEVPRSGVAEIGELAAALSAMARSLEQRASYIRSFASHVSHEFKTPLAAIRGSTELLHDHWATMSAEERAAFLEKIEEACARLDRLVSRLLEQARADVFRPGGEIVDVRDVVRTAVDRARGEGMTIRSDLPEAPVRARIGADVLASVVESLIDNAKLHAGAGSPVAATVRATRDLVSILVEDEGPGVSDSNASKLFTPFFTTARERGGSGLGLTIARSLLEAHGGSLTLERGSPGAAFAIRLPLA